MIAIPFIYFSIFAYYLYRRNNRAINVPVYIMLIYAISGFFAILMDLFDLRSLDTVNYQFSLRASLTYCLCITFAVLPLLGKGVEMGYFTPISVKNSTLKTFARIAIVFFLFYAIMSVPDMLRTLTGDMKEMRADNASGLGEDLWYAKINPTIRFPIILLKFFLGVPWIMIFMAFYVRIIQRLPISYAIMFLFTSLIGPIDGIMGVDRSKVVYWLISLIGVFIYFKPLMSATERKKYIKIGYIIVGLLVFYLVAMTIARFGEDVTNNSMDGSSSSLVSYIGMPYINFCFFFDNYDPKLINPATLFPFITQYLILGGYGTGTQFQAYLTYTTSYEFGVFYTYLGAIHISLGALAVYIYTAFIFVLGSLFTRKRKSNAHTLYHSYTYLLFASVPMLGLFTHYYSYATASFGAIAFWVLTAIYSRRKK